MQHGRRAKPLLPNLCRLAKHIEASHVEEFDDFNKFGKFDDVLQNFVKMSVMRQNRRFDGTPLLTSFALWRKFIKVAILPLILIWRNFVKLAIFVIVRISGHISKWLLTNADITFPRAESDRLILVASLSLSP